MLNLLAENSQVPHKNRHTSLRRVSKPQVIEFFTDF